MVGVILTPSKTSPSPYCSIPKTSSAFAAAPQTFLGQFANSHNPIFFSQAAVLGFPNQFVLQHECSKAPPLLHQHQSQELEQSPAQFPSSPYSSFDFLGVSIGDITATSELPAAPTAFASNCATLACSKLTLSNAICGILLREKMHTQAPKLKVQNESLPITSRQIKRLES
ncbi:hypothetical protein GOP47_0003532 [Adiantum capillus-veneris]|uniref:Uncharacterized protein n=1 Tax=Adiantum capillus-veneris TaxID=13818 RepID=A0A9D4VCE6_ADICA|nr:hypothetical protein GOP47_0003532 [Adiantum capillus-veneris]